jgi:hypothetical protein
MSNPPLGQHALKDNQSRGGLCFMEGAKLSDLESRVLLDLLLSTTERRCKPPRGDRRALVKTVHDSLGVTGQTITTEDDTANPPGVDKSLYEDST